MLNYIGQKFFSVAIRISAFAFLVMAILVIFLLVAPVSPSSQPATECNVLIEVATLIMLIASLAMCFVIETSVATLKSRCEKRNAKIWKLMMDKVASARENATLKSRCEEGDEKIRKLTMDKENLAKEVATLKSGIANVQMLWKTYM